MKKIKFLVPVLTLTLFVPYSYGANAVSSSDSAGAEQQRFEEDAEREKAIQNIKKKVDSVKESEPEVQESELAAADQGVSFNLNKVEFTGNEKISSEKLQGVVADSVGKKVNMAQLRQLTSKVKSYYRTNGYVAAYVFLPPQDVTSGNVRMEVVEGRLGAIEIKGNKWFSERTIKRMLGVTPGSVLSYGDLRGGLSFLNRNRDLKVSSVLKPGKEPRTTDLELNVKDKFPVHLSTDVNNLGTRDTGRTRWGLGLTDTNLLGLMDELSTRFQLGSGAVGVATRYTVPLNSSGTALSLGYSFSHVDLENEFAALDVEGNAHTYSFDISQPIVKEQLPGDVFAEIGVNAGFDFKDIENTVLNQKAGNDQLRILNLGLNPEFTDRWGKTYFPHSFHFGFADFLGASDVNETSGTRAGTGGQFFIYRGSFIRYQKLPADMIFSLRGTWQLTPDSLAPSEQFHLGGAFSVRGYKESAYLADYGGILSTELIVPTYFFPKDWKLPFSSEPLRKQIQGVAFFDLGGGGLRRPLAGESDDKVLSGMGGGLRIHLFDRVYGRFQWAGRTGEKANSGSKSAFYYGISAELF